MTIATQQSPTMDSASMSEGENVSEIQSLTSQVEQLSNAADFWNKAMLWALVVAAIAAVVIVVTTRLAITRAKQLSIAQDNLNRAKDRLLASDLKLKDVAIASAQGQAGEANKAASEANERSTALAVEALRLQKQLMLQGARENLITGENRSKLVDALKLFPGQLVDVRRSAFPFMVNGKIVSVTPIGDDTVGLAEALLRVVKDAGWLSPPTVLPWGIQETGISVEITDEASPKTRSAADALVRALSGLSLSVSGPVVLPFGSNRFARVGTVEQAMPPLLGKDTILLGVLTHPK
jgi:hypothetical protein